MIRVPYEAFETKERKKVSISYPPKGEKNDGEESITELKQIMEAVIMEQIKAAQREGEPGL